MRTPHLRTLVLALIIASFGVVGDAYAGTIFNNFGPANSYDSANAWAVYGSASNPPNGVEEAMRFTPVGNWILTQIDVALWNSTGTNSAVLTLNSDSGGTPGAVLATWNLSSLPHIGSCCTVETVTPSSSLFLGSGSTYWLVASPGATDSIDGWNWNNTGSNGVSLQHNPGWSSNPGSTLSAFDVQGNPAPEPTSLVLFSFGVT